MVLEVVVKEALDLKTDLVAEVAVVALVAEVAVKAVEVTKAVVINQNVEMIALAAMQEIKVKDAIVTLERGHLHQKLVFLKVETSLNLVGSVVENLNQTPVAPAEEEEDAINFFIFNIPNLFSF